MFRTSKAAKKAPLKAALISVSEELPLAEAALKAAKAAACTTAASFAPDCLADRAAMSACWFQKTGGGGGAGVAAELKLLT
jgi:hypothetical protein